MSDRGMSTLAMLVEQIGIDEEVTLYTVGGHEFAGYVSEWFWQDGVVHIRAFRDNPGPQYFVPISQIVGLQTNGR